MRQKQVGFTYIAAMFFVALMGAGLAATGIVWGHAVKREKEHELLHVGAQIRDAIRLYYERTPGAVKRYPQALEDLLLDKRYLSTQRYLRKIFEDPMTGRAEWGYIKAPDGGIMGVHSLAIMAPVKTGNFGLADLSFSRAKSYADWKFIYVAPIAVSGVKNNR